MSVYVYMYIVYCPTPGFCPGETWVAIPFISIDNKLGFDNVYMYIMYMYDIRCVLCVNDIYIYTYIRLVYMLL